MRLSPVMTKFILHWGEMGTRWGINRTVAQVHALLYLSPQPLNAEEIAETLAVARSNVSTSLRELLSWGVVKPVHLLGDRREHFEAMKDVWEMARVILDTRKRREIDPTVSVLRECAAELKDAEPSDAHMRQRLLDMLALLETLTALYDEMQRLPKGTVRGVARLRGKLRRVLNVKAPD
ncbi:MAG: MarR family transcriptional regulator [Acidobacteriia bacterium]|nr:MarR family transcriptional regulator [Terriglobia bacterium]